MSDSTSLRRWSMWALRLVVLVVVIAGVGRTFQSALARLGDRDWRLEPLWLIASAALYAAGLLPMAWFWHRALAALGQTVPWPPALRAYYLGHLGKYTPGKALVVVLRVGAVHSSIESTWLAVMSIIVETLMMMAVGAFLAAVLSIVTLKLEPGLIVLAVLMAVGAFFPTLPPVASRLARFGGRRLSTPNHGASTTSAHPGKTDRIAALLTWKLWAEGWIASLICWTLLGLSLWAVVRSIGVESLSPIADLPLVVATVSLAVVAGFASLLPGGIVVRDALIMQLLAPACGDANALFAAVLLRIVWLVSELAVCGILYGAAMRGRFR